MDNDIIVEHVNCPDCDEFTEELLARQAEDAKYTAEQEARRKRLAILEGMLDSYTDPS